LAFSSAASGLAPINSNVPRSLSAGAGGSSSRYLEGYIMNSTQRITIDPNICHGKPCVRGLRNPVTTILELLAAGMTHEEIRTDYSDLEEEDILACLEYAARLSKVKWFVRTSP
jgi:uncharacterized protein (DUF433 family)